LCHGTLSHALDIRFSLRAGKTLVKGRTASFYKFQISVID
jgi:hypothetical protein